MNTGQEFDGSDSGARPDEAVSWGKIKMTASPVKVKDRKPLHKAKESSLTTLLRTMYIRATVALLVTPNSPLSWKL